MNLEDAAARGAVVTGAVIRAWIEKSAQVLAENRRYLSELDSPIGDADHGNNMDRGFKAVLQKLPDGDDSGVLLKSVAMTLISKVGGAAGPLYGTFYLEASKPLMGKTTLTGTEVAQLFDVGIAGVKKRGRSDIGMKTMLDALVPAANAFRTAYDTNTDVVVALSTASKAAEEGMKATIPMQAQRGRASYLGERSIGHQDPGATSSYMIVQAFADAAAGVPG